MHRTPENILMLLHRNMLLSRLAGQTLQEENQLLPHLSAEPGEGWVH
jgi:hypothetical protein